MNKKVYNSGLVLLLIIAAAFVSCKKDFLEITPKGKKIAKTTNDYGELLQNLNIVNIVANAQFLMGDEVAAVADDYSFAGVRDKRLFQWEDRVYEPDQNAYEMYVLMENIYTFNLVINEVMSSTGGSEQQKKYVRAQALAQRAWTYFLLINFYGAPYEALKAASDPGFPIVTTADVNKKEFTRSSVKEVYEFIINDLKTALPDLPSEITHRYIMSQAAAAGTLGKVYVFMGEFEKALPYFNTAIDDIKNNKAIAVGLYDYNQTFAPGGSWLPIDMFFGVERYPEPQLNIENVLAKVVRNDWALGGTFVTTKETAELYQSDDQRLNWFAKGPLFSPDYLSGNLRRIPGGFLDVQFGVRVPELYLLRAETRARLGDLSGATTDAKTLRLTRISPGGAEVPTAIASDQVALVKFILEERIREFAMQGYRWFDMRRLSVDPIYKTTLNYTHKIYSSEEKDKITQTFKLRPERLVMRFTDKLMSENPGMQNNP